MASDPRYDFPIVAASKVIIRKGDSILLTREPLDNAWMPGRLALPGGKYLLNEGILDGTKRKIDNEAGVKCDLKGLFKIVNILMPEKTVYHFIFVADYISGELETTDHFSSELKWMTEEEALKLSKDDVTEYYLDGLLRAYFENPDKLEPLDFITELRSYKDPEIQSWMTKGSSKEK